MSTTQRIKKIAATKIRNAILDNHLEDFFEYFLPVFLSELGYN